MTVTVKYFVPILHNITDEIAPNQERGFFCFFWGRVFHVIGQNQIILVLLVLFVLFFDMRS